MKSPLRPMALAALCWLLVALVPPARDGLLRAGRPPIEAQTSFSIADAVSQESAPPTIESEAMRRFPQDPRVQLGSLAQLGKVTPQKIEVIAQKWANDPVALTLILRAYINHLKSDRIEGPLSNPGGPGAPTKKTPGGTSPTADYNRFIALARRGQTLEPNNTFFDWMLLYGLYALRRDAEARQVLQITARKTDYDDHSREIILNRLAVVRLVKGAPTTPGDSYLAWANILFPELSRMRQSARWVMEGAIADRTVGFHQRALDAPFALAKMGRTVRRESHNLIGSLVGTAIEGIAISRITMPPPLSFTGPRPRPVRFGASLATYQASPISLYAYANTQKRTDITQFLSREWIEIGQWRKLSGVVIDQNWTGTSPAQAVVLTLAERLRSMILHALPAVLISGTIFTLLSRRFYDDSGAFQNGFWRGVWCCLGLFALALLFDGIIALRGENTPDEWWSYLSNTGLLSTIPLWVTLGLTWGAILSALGTAIRWQGCQSGQIVSLKKRFQTTFDAPEDGLMRFDFSWIFGLVAKCTGWMLLVGGFLNLCFNYEEMSAAFGFSPSALGAGFLIAVLLIGLFLHYVVWRNKPRQAVTLRLGLRLVSQSLLGFFVASSALYALVAFGMLPLAFGFERNFQNAMERGEVQIARAKLGL